jgi:hypothetical protein
MEQEWYEKLEVENKQLQAEVERLKGEIQQAIDWLKQQDSLAAIMVAEELEQALSKGAKGERK